MTEDELIEAVALALVNRDQERFDMPRIETVADFRCQEDASEYLANARAAISVIAPPVERLQRERDQAVEALRAFQRHVIRHSYSWDAAENGSHHHPIWAQVASVLAAIEGEPK